MSYDFWLEVDTGGEEPLVVEPCFGDRHPALGGDGVAGTVMVTPTGYMRCGNYTSNVSAIWTRCLTAAMPSVGIAHHFAGRDDRCMLETYGPEILYVDGTEGERAIRTDRLCLRDLQGGRCADLIDLLKAAVEYGVESLADLRDLEPDNGWGNAEGAITYLWDIQRMCERHPNAELRISS